MISIVTPLFNKVQSFDGTARCVLEQTMPDFEWVIVDGWSTDGSLEKAQELASREPRIKLLMQQNRKGVTPARNEGVRSCRGEVIAFIDADDIWEPGYLEALQNLISDYPEAGIWGLAYGVQQEAEDGSIGRTPAGSGKGFRGALPGDWSLGCPYWTGATAISKKAFEEVGGFDESIIYGEDIDLWYRLILRGSAVFDGSIEPLAFYRTDAENRACARSYKPEIDIPFHIGKYADARVSNAAFRKFFDLQMLYRLWPYAGKREYSKQVREVLRQIDFSLQKPSLKWRFVFPGLYRKFTGR